MQRKLPGTDVSAATEANILHAAAFIEFKQHVERLAREGSDLAAYTCWTHGVESCHSPYVMATGTDSDLFPPLPKMPCCIEHCNRCAARFGGFKFPWLGLWNSRGVILSPDVAPNEAWDYCYRHQERMDLCWWRTPTSQQHPTWCRRSSMACSSGAQRVTLGNWALEKSSINGAPGSTASAAEGCWQSSWSRVLTHELPGGDPGKRGGQTDPVPTGHFAAGWRAKQQALCSLVLPALTAVILPGASAGHAAWDYVVPASPGGSLVGTERRKMLSDV